MMLNLHKILQSAPAALLGKQIILQSLRFAKLQSSVGWLASSKMEGHFISQAYYSFYMVFE